MHRLLAASQVAPASSPAQVVRVPHRHIPTEQVSPATAHVTDAHKSKNLKNQHLIIIHKLNFFTRFLF